MVRGGLPRLTFGNQRLINKDLSITSSILCIALSIDYTFEFFVASPKDIIPRLCGDVLYLSLDHSLYKYCNLIGHKQETKQLKTTCQFLEPLVTS